MGSGWGISLIAVGPFDSLVHHLWWAQSTTAGPPRKRIARAWSDAHRDRAFEPSRLAEYTRQSTWFRSPSSNIDSDHRYSGGSPSGMVTIHCPGGVEAAGGGVEAVGGLELLQARQRLAAELDGGTVSVNTVTPGLRIKPTMMTE